MIVEPIAPLLVVVSMAALVCAVTACGRATGEAGEAREDSGVAPDAAFGPDAADDTIAEASAPLCGAGCGGNVQGDWVLRAMPCSSPTTRGHRFGLCDVQTVSDIDRVDGAAVFADDGTVQVDPPFRVAYREQMIYPKSCLDREGWSTCNDLADFSGDACADAGGDCECNSSREVSIPIHSGTWATDGVALAITSPETFGNAIEFEYCARDARLTLTLDETYELVRR